MSAVPFHSWTPDRVVLSNPSGQEVADISAIRDFWLEYGLSTRRSDRASAESAVAQLYRRSCCAEPEFIWVPSPRAASELIEAEGLASNISLADDAIARHIAGMISLSRERMTARVPNDKWQHSDTRLAIEAARVMTPEHAIEAGVDLRVVIRSGVQDPLRTSLFDGIAPAIRTITTSFSGLVTWYGQQEAHHIAAGHALLRYGRARPSPDDVELLEIQSTLVTATGWWWAFDDVCVMSERPSALHTEPTPGGVHNERRLHHADRPAVEFIDGAAVHVLHGTIVPDWVVSDPTPERIAQERNIEVRRSAIEHIGWDAYIDAAGLTLVDQADDPGNSGCLLQLYATPREWRTNGKILLAVNGSRERDGHRRRYGLQVPGFVPSALDAAGWTYGIRGDDYAGLVRRT
ncbi:DUF6745 domain-containing protein [Gordonia sp. SL306]|uniref:DUF6745 domain-containing protein n=1 Tax=Gordonia sp. SL306 TaxID=2995145 RepID=UPI0022712CCF|nr:hypothetical protein [Gordonia sp. SL306]WAC56772.1 hypothetical protein OVA31_05840 [Gordonia sp. SL306]